MNEEKKVKATAAPYSASYKAMSLKSIEQSQTSKIDSVSPNDNEEQKDKLVRYCPAGVIVQ